MGVTEVLNTLGEVWRAVLAFLVRTYAQAAALARTLDPLVWWVGGGVVLALILLWLLLRRRSATSSRPEVLLSLGTIVSQDGVPEGGVDRPGARHRLRLTVSNLNPYAVQVLEFALKTPEMKAPVTAEVAAVVPPEGSVVLEEPVEGLFGDEGRLNVYFYTVGGRGVYRLQAPFTLEPWNERYKISPVNQSVTPARRLASAEVSRVQEQRWRERGPGDFAGGDVPNRPRPADRPHRTEPPPAAERGEVFPDEF